MLHLPPLSPLITNDLHHTGLHQLWGLLQAPVQGWPQYLVKQVMDHGFILHEPPQVELQVVAVHLHLLQPIPAEGFQPHALQQGFQT